MKRNPFIAIAATMLMAMPVVLMAGPFGRGGGPGMGPGGGPGMGPGGGFVHRLLGRLGDHLELSDDQRQAIEAVVEANREQLEDLHEQIAAGREAFRESQQPGQFDEEAVRAHAASQSALHAEVMVIAQRTKAEIYNLLTPEQQQELESLHELLAPRGEGRGDGPCGGKRGSGRGPR